VGGGAWPFLVGGAICLVNSDNERDSSLLNRLVISTGSVSTRVDLGMGCALVGWQHFAGCASCHSTQIFSGLDCSSIAGAS
jgi:hypothetical protein